MVMIVCAGFWRRRCEYIIATYDDLEHAVVPAPDIYKQSRASYKVERKQESSRFRGGRAKKKSTCFKLGSLQKLQKKLRLRRNRRKKSPSYFIPSLILHEVRWEFVKKSLESCELIENFFCGFAKKSILSCTPTNQPSFRQSFLSLSYSSPLFALAQFLHHTLPLLRAKTRGKDEEVITKIHQAF